jgi:hypothetical protein
MDDGKIQKAARKANLVLSSGRRIRGNVFVWLYDSHHFGPQRVGELLNENLAFLPIKTDKGVVLVNRTHIVSAALPADREHDELVKLGKRYEVRVTTTNGAVRGAVFVNLPAVTNRVADYFNQPIRFLPLFQARTVIYLNRDFILLVRD